jgi:hypothetical protein
VIASPPLLVGALQLRTICVPLAATGAGVAPEAANTGAVAVVRGVALAVALATDDPYAFLATIVTL